MSLDPQPGARSHLGPLQCAALCTKGLEEILASELAQCGADAIEPGRGGVRFRGDVRVLYRALLELRTAVRVLLELCQGPARSADELYELVRSIDWHRILTPENTLAVTGAVRDSAIIHGGFAALKTKDAIVDQLRDRHGRRPDVDRDDPDVRVYLKIAEDHATISLDAAGPSLHKRGYRPIQVKSPLNEARAAGMLLMAGWDGSSVLVDPMCGSGTILIEAALLATHTAPGLLRPAPAARRWPDFDRALWGTLVDAALARVRPLPPGLLFGADVHPGAISLARSSAARAGFAEGIRFDCSDVRDWTPTAPPSAVFVNPPYGERLGDAEELPDLYRALGTFLKKKCLGATAYVLSGNPELTRYLGLKASRKWVLFNGPIECRVLRYEMR